MGRVNAPTGTGLYEVIEECFEKLTMVTNSIGSDVASADKSFE